ncbi:LytR/AlgR family response regulator transcription factor [Piscinibacter terrae]|uniref:DNA-binding response regulator n=1 Tax=Piscinibacter terrae TaxID=2496871 RepID=A0A3N7JVC3_9BURK|nr:LytTR family DNA-binding domain-containing protein [Albitalea terrae]RQP24829.1 DNA-binding response regulator [Albitalea terrae]
MRLFIADDEAPARDRLIDALARVAPHARVAGAASSVREARTWLQANEPPDLMLLDIQLSDGLSLELFRDGVLSSPVVFTTAYDEFVMQAFQAQALDYLLKPVNEDRLAQVFAKHARLRQHFAGNVAALMADLQSPPATRRRRIVGRKGTQFVAIPVEQVAYFVSQDKLSFVVAMDGTRCLVDSPLADIEAGLDPAVFFRLNRQYLVSAQSVARFGAAGKGRLSVELVPRSEDEVSVSQERASAFRDWLAQ